MKTTHSICPADNFIHCSNCGRWIKAGTPVVTTVMPNLVTIAHAVCPMREAYTSRRWAEDHWDYVEQKGAE
jgi:hypothetical protein